MSGVRSTIASRIEEEPGIHFNELVRTLDLAPGQVQHHLRALLGDGDVVEEPLYGRTHYYPPAFDEWERSALALARRETTREVLLYLLREGEARPTAVTDALGIARSTLAYHVDRLVEADLVEKRRGDGNRVTLVVRRPEETARLLGAVHPSLPERLTDRFERLVDGLLES